MIGSFVCMLVSGCSEPRAGPVDQALAVESLKQMLDTWRSGGDIQDMQKKMPPIVAQEIAWQQGKRLQDYVLLDQGRIEDANLFCEVELVLVEPGDGQQVTKKKVTYVIGTDPVITVFRAIL